jgi:hypothetical protein
LLPSRIKKLEIVLLALLGPTSHLPLWHTTHYTLTSPPRKRHHKQVKKAPSKARNRKTCIIETYLPQKPVLLRPIYRKAGILLLFLVFFLCFYFASGALRKAPAFF